MVLTLVNFSSQMLNHQTYILRAITLAKEAMHSGKGSPFGAVVVIDDKIVGESGNTTKQDCDPTAHAEIMAIRNACKKLENLKLDGATLYTSCYPCPMCMAAVYWSGIKKVVYAATNEDTISAGFDDSLIYKELCLPDNEKSIELEQKEHLAGQVIFSEWKMMKKLRE